MKHHNMSCIKQNHFTVFITMTGLFFCSMGLMRKGRTEMYYSNRLGLCFDGWGVY